MVLSDKAAKVSKNMSELMTTVEQLLSFIAGERVPFVLVLQTDDIVQYAANIEREDSKFLLKNLVERWDTETVQVPAHLNPELNPGEPDATTH